MNRLKTAVFLLVGVLFATLVGVTALELLFGSWFSSDPWRELDRINLQRNVRLTLDTQALYGSDMPSVTYTRDAYGLRSGCENPSAIEILSVGGSTTDQLFISDGQTFQDVLQDRLSQALGRSVCIANAGVDGHSTFAHIEALERWFPRIPGLHPKYFLLYLGINDAGIRLTPQIDFDLNRKIVESPLIYTLSQKSALYGLGRTIKQVLQGDQGNQFAWHHKNTPRPDQYTADQVTPGIAELVDQNTAAFSGRLETIIALIRQRYGAKPICVSQPNLMTTVRDGRLLGIPQAFRYEGRQFNGLDYDRSIKAINSAMKTICLAAGGSYIDLASVTYPTTAFYDAVHMGPTGARLVGNELFEAMQRQGIVRAMRDQPSPGARVPSGHPK